MLTKYLLIIAILIYPALHLYLYVAGNRGGLWDSVRFVLLLPLMGVAAVLEFIRWLRGR